MFGNGNVQTIAISILMNLHLMAWLTPVKIMLNGSNICNLLTLSLIANVDDEGLFTLEHLQRCYFQPDNDCIYKQIGSSFAEQKQVVNSYIESEDVPKLDMKYHGRHQR